MSAMNAFLGADAVHIVTDGAAYNPSGQTLSVMQKVSILGHLPAIIATRGSCLLTQMAGSAASIGCKSFDALAEDLGGFCKAIHETYAAYSDANGEPANYARSDFLIAGWSDSRQRLETYAISNAEDGEFAAWRPSLFTGDDYLISPDSDDLDWQGIEAEIGNFARCPEIAAVRLLEAQRRLVVPGHESPPLGAFVQVTTLTREGISTRIVKRWPEAAAA